MKDGTSHRLAEEFLTDVAGSFFDARLRLEAMIETFEASAERLRREADKVAGAAAALWRALLEEDSATALFHRLGIDASPFARAARKATLSGPVVVPKLWGRRRRYARTVEDAYQRLAREVRRYQEGPPETERGATAAVYYNLVLEMARIVNQQVLAVNSLMSPSTALQYVKQFNPSQLERERITGGGCQGLAGDLDTCLAFQPVSPEAMGLPVYPLLPPL